MTCWCPPVWKMIMDPMLDAMEKGEKLSEQQVKE
jgi:hypothetical protein